MKTFFATFAAILCAAAVIWGFWSWKAGVDARRESDRTEFDSTAAHALKMRDMLSDFESWHPEKLKPADPFSTEPVQWADVVLATDLLRRLKANRGGVHVRNTIADYVRGWRDIVAIHGKKSPDWAAQMTAVLDQIEAEAARK